MLEPRELTGSPEERPWKALPHHLRTRRSIELHRLKFGVPEKLLNLLNRHAPLYERRRDGMPEEMRIPPLGDLRLLRCFLDDLLDTSR